jgi:GNAT superfamily N-acetyltransferase
MTTVRPMAVDELARIAEIDRSERITQQYRQRDGALELIEVDIDAPRWGEPGEHPVRHYFESWKPMLDDGGLLLGAFDDDRLVGFAIYLRSIEEGLSQLAVLHVTRTHRRHGVGRDLSGEVVRRARQDGAKRLYVSATPTRSTVDFYMAQGFEPLEIPNERLYALEPDDIHMELRL